MALVRLVVDATNLTQAQVEELYRTFSNEAIGSALALGRFLEAIGSGFYPGTIEHSSGAVRATATITFTGAPVNNETCSILGTTFTAKTSGATGNQFNIGGTETITAANLAAAINASATASVTGSITASSSAGVVTMTARVPGAAGNGYRVTESLTNATAVYFAGGSNGTQTTYSLT